MSLNLVSDPSSLLKVGGQAALGVYNLISSDSTIAFAIDQALKTIDIKSAGGGVALLNKWDATVNPTVSNDTTQGYSVGSFWFNQLTNHLYLAKDVSAGAAEWVDLCEGVLTRDVLDNATEIISLGAVSEIRQATIEYIFQLPLLNKQISGEITVSHDGLTAAIIKHEYSYQNADIDGLTYGASISGGQLRLEITANAVGENGKFSFKKQTKPLF
jgi:hypothetical protein